MQTRQQEKSQLLVIYNQLTLTHKLTKKPHPQRPQRVAQLVNHLKKLHYKKYLESYQEVLKSQTITNEQIQAITKQNLIAVHGLSHFQFIQGMWCQGISKPQMFMSVDTYYSKDTFQSAFQAVKTVLLSLIKGLTNPSMNIFSIIRPPGHHSGMKQRPHGFSFFNNVAVGAEYYTKTTNKNAVIIDWDIHHGEGTQKIFYKRKDVLYISLHRFDQGKFFPHVKQSGSEYMGQGQGQGYNVNICWNLPEKQLTAERSENQTVGDNQYLYCFQKIVVPILKQYQFGCIFVSCGFDSAEGDRIGKSKITKKGYFQMSKALSSMGKPIYLILQGGYCIDSIQWGTEAVIQGLKEGKKKSLSTQEQVQRIYLKDLNQFSQEDIESSLKFIRKYWKIQQ